MIHRSVVSIIGIIWYIGMLSSGVFSISAATEGIREVNLRLNDLVYDSVTQKLYATGRDDTNNLLQLDPQTGSTVRTFPIGLSPSRLVLDNRRGLWVGLNAEGAVRRFNLDTLEAGPKISVHVGSNNAIFDIAPSAADNDTFAVAVGIMNESRRAYLVRDGVLLPEGFQMQSVVLQGNYVFGQFWDAVYRTLITQNGLLLDVGRLIGFGSGEQKLFDGLLYYASGVVIDPANLAAVAGFTLPLPVDVLSPPVLDLSTENDTALFLSKSTHWHLTRFDRPRRELTGLFRFEVSPGEPLQLAAMGTNRAAFHTADKLFLLDLDPLLARGDLELLASAEPNPALFGKQTTQTITVTNKGPGYVINAVLTNRLGANVSFPVPPEGVSVTFFLDIWQTDQVTWNLGTIPPGQSRTVRFSVAPLAPGAFTNFISVGSDLEIDSQNNSLQLVVPVSDTSTNTLFSLTPGGTNMTALAYDSASNKLLLGDAPGQIFRIDLDQPRIDPPGQTSLGPVEDISSENGIAWIGVHGWGTLYRIPLDTFAGKNSTLQVTFRDLEASPTDTNVVAISLSSGVQIFRATSGFFIPYDKVSGSGLIEFSSDGRKIYQISDLDCSLRVLNLGATNLTVERSIPDFGCSDFTEFGGLLYFDTGLIYDPTAGNAVTNLNLTAPSLVVPEDSGLNVISRTSSGWVVRHLSKTNYQEIAGLQLDAKYSPRKAVSVGERKFAFLDASGEIVVVQLPTSAATLQFEVRKIDNAITLRFPTVPGARYRLEQSDSIPVGTWTPSGEEIVGAGFVIERPVTASNQKQFYRLVRL